LRPSPSRAHDAPCAGLLDYARHTATRRIDPHAQIVELQIIGAPARHHIAQSGPMSSGILFAIAIGALALAIAIGLMRRGRASLVLIGASLHRRLVGGTVSRSLPLRM